jgi:hypothetical protein
MKFLRMPASILDMLFLPLGTLRRESLAPPPQRVKEMKNLLKVHRLHTRGERYVPF